MVNLDKIYTRGGDTGQTSLAGGTRVPKHDLRVEAYGTVDEANAFIGLARLTLEGQADEILGRIQNDLFDLGADLARPKGAPNDPAEQKALRIGRSQVDRLEAEIDVINEGLNPLTSFVLPGGMAASAYLHTARTIVRRAERLTTALMQAEPINAPALIYLNRLSDHLFVLARQHNDGGVSDVLWVPGANI